jgi:hypothetical protein
VRRKLAEVARGVKIRGLTLIPSMRPGLDPPARFACKRRRDDEEWCRLPCRQRILGWPRLMQLRGGAARERLPSG